MVGREQIQMKGRAALLAVLVLVALLLDVGSARAELTAAYVVKRPGFELVLKEEGRAAPSVVYLRTKVYCEWFGEDGEGRRKVSHVGFQRGGRLRMRGRYLHLGRGLDTNFESDREALKAEFHPNGKYPDSIVGTFYSVSAGEAIGGKCQTGGFKGDAHLSFVARRFLPLGAPGARRPVPAVERLYGQDFGPGEIFLWASRRAVTEIRGRVGTVCSTRGGKESRYRRPFQLRPPFALTGSDNRFRGRSGRRWPSQVGSALLTGQLDKEAAAGTYRAAFAFRRGKNHRFHAWCRNVGNQPDGAVHFHATRLVPMARTAR